MIDRDSELLEIEEYIRNHEIEKGPTAFVARSQQANVPDRPFIHRSVKNTRGLWPSSVRFKKG